MQQWCERRGVPLPEFWFPPGWKLEYEWPDDDPTESPPSTSSDPAGKESTEERKQRVDKKYAHLSSEHLAIYVDRLSGLKAVGNGEVATIQLRSPQRTRA